MQKQFALLLSCSIFSNLLCYEEPQDPTSLLATLASTPTHQDVALSDTSRAILHLFYATQHLNPALTFIKNTIDGSKKVEKQCSRQVISFFSGTSILKNQKIKIIFSHIAQTESLLPLLRMWEQVRQFKYGICPEEKSILLDFSKLCLITYQSLLTCLNHKQTSALPCITPERLDSLEHIDEVFETMEECSLFYFLRKTPYKTDGPLPTLPPSFPALCINEFCASFALRYYLNKRLRNTFCSFSSFHKKNLPLFTHGIEYLGFEKGDIVFDDQVIAGYFTLLQEEKRLDPLIQLIGQFYSFDFIKNPTFIKEFLVLLCIAYKDLLLKNTITTRSTETIEELHELSLEQLLSLLDNITEKYGERPFVGMLKTKRPSQQQKNRTQVAPSVPALIKNEYGVSPDTFTHLVFHRYYYVKRLREVVKILLKLTTQNSVKISSFFKTSLPLKPLAMVWEDFSAYKEVNDQHLIDDFTKEIFILSQTVLHNSVNHHYAQVLQTFSPKKEQPSPEKTLAREQSILAHDFKPSIEVDKVISRFYFIRRLGNIITTISLLNEKNLLHLGCNCTTTGADPCLQHLNFTKEPILAMIREIYQTHSFKPVFILWQGINRYKYIEDEEVCSEFARFVTHLIHSTSTHYATPRCAGIFIEGKGFLPLDQLQDMPLEDILNLLDVLVEELPNFLKENEITSDMNWKEWLKKYWLIAPLKTVIFSISVYLMYKGILEKSKHHPVTTPVLTPPA